MDGWPVLMVTTGNELLAVQKIEAAGFIAYCPTIKYFTKPKRKHSPVEVVKAAFPGYLFAAPGFLCASLSNTARFFKVRHLILGNEFCSVPEAEIVALQAEDDNRAVKVTEASPFAVGDRVRVVKGPFSGLKATVGAVHGHECGLTVDGFYAKTYMPSFSLEKIG